MSFNEGYGNDYGELFEYDEAPVIIEGPTSGYLNRLPPPSDRLPRRCSSEISIDLNDLKELNDLQEESSSRWAQGSMYSNNASSDGPSSLWQHQQYPLHLSDDEDGGEYGNNRSANSSIIKFDEIPEGFFQQNESSPISAREHLHQNQQQPLTTVDERGETESEGSMSMSSLVVSLGSSSRNLLQASNGSLCSRRKVKFERSTRLEDIQEYEKPDVEDYHMLYYTAHELQKMIDDHREEEENERHVVR